MRRVHELHVEPFLKLCRKRLHRRRSCIHVGVTDDAHRLLFGISELADVAADARIVTGEFKSGRLWPFAPVTRVALELFVFGDLVRKSPECLVGRPNRDRVGSFR